MRTRSRLAFVLSVISCLACASARDPAPLSPLEVSPRQRAMVDAIAAALAAPMRERPPEAALLLDLEGLYEPLSPEQRDFLHAIRHLDGADPTRSVATGVDWVRIEDQRVRGPGGQERLSLALLPRAVWEAWREMDEAMRAELGRGLLIGSGYRSPANQLFVFVSYLPHYAYSPAKIRSHVSLPGASDHNRVERQGIDFVSEDGVDLRYSDPAAFRALDEFRWLLENADRFGFATDAPDGVSPWHWHYRRP